MSASEISRHSKSLQSGRRGDGRQHQGHVAQHLRPAHEEAEDESQRGVRIPDPGRRAAADRYGPGHADGNRSGGESGIIFLDEIDKIAGREGGHGPDVSREGVQRDILPIVEGTTVNTRYGMVRTDHILFIAAGAFHVSKPSDLIPGVAGPFSDSRGTAVADDGGFHTNSDGAEVVAGEAVHGVARDGRRQAGIHAGGARRDRALRLPGKRKHRKYRRAALHTIMERVLDETQL